MSSTHPIHNQPRRSDAAACPISRQPTTHMHTQQCLKTRCLTASWIDEPSKHPGAWRRQHFHRLLAWDKRKLVSKIQFITTRYRFLILKRAPRKSDLVVWRLLKVLFLDKVTLMWSRFFAANCKTMWRCNRAGNLIICVSSRLQTRFTAQPWRLNGVIMIQIASSDFISAAKEDGCHSARNFASLLKGHPANPPSDCHELWLIRGDFHTRLTFPCCLISGSRWEMLIDVCH